MDLPSLLDRFLDSTRTLVSSRGWSLVHPRLEIGLPVFNALPSVERYHRMSECIDEVVRNLNATRDPARWSEVDIKNLDDHVDWTHSLVEGPSASASSVRGLPRNPVASPAASLAASLVASLSSSLASSLASTFVCAEPL